MNAKLITALGGLWETLVAVVVVTAVACVLSAVTSVVLAAIFGFLAILTGALQ